MRAIFKSGIFLTVVLIMFCAGISRAEIGEDGRIVSAEANVVRSSESIQSQAKFYTGKLLNDAAGTVIVDFDDLPACDGCQLYCNYAGLTWDCQDLNSKWWSWQSESEDPSYSEPHSGDNYLYNSWGVNDLGFSLPEETDRLLGAWFAVPNVNSQVDSVRFNGYDSSEMLVQQSDWLALSGTPQYLAANFTPVSRIEVEHSDSDAAWYTMDDLTYETGDSECLVPEIPTNPYPPDAAEDVPVNICLSWNDGLIYAQSSGFLGMTYSDDELDEEGNLKSSIPLIMNDFVQIESFGDVVNSFSSPGTYPFGLAWKDGYLYNTDSNNDMIYRLDSNSGSVLSTFGPIQNISDITWDGIQFWGTNATSDTIFRFTATGTILQTFPAPGSGPVGITWDGYSLWVCDWSTDTIYEIDPSNGSTLSSFAAPDTRVAGMAFDGTALWTNGRDSAVTYRISRTNGAVLDSFVTPPGIDQNNGQGCTFDGQYLWIANYDAKKIYKVDIDQASQTTCSTTWDLYLGTDIDVLELVASDLSQPWYCLCESPCGLKTWTRYYWRIVAKNSSGQTYGPIWSFTTECPVDLNNDGLVDISDLDIFFEKWLENLSAN